MKNYQYNLKIYRGSAFAKRVIGFALVFVLFFVFKIPAQNENAGMCCGNVEMEKLLYQQYPDLEQRANAKYVQSQIEGRHNIQSRQNASSIVYIIPVVFHILHEYGSENISDAQVFDAMMHLNEDFRKLNADTAQLVAPFDTLAADCQIEFRLAQIDPNGNCTNGIERIPSFYTTTGDNCQINQWPRDKYLNIWVTRNLGSICAYAYLPSQVDSLPALDGIVIKNSCLGTIGTGNIYNAHLLSHEAGHYLGLLHTWGGSFPGNICGDDGIADTPITMGWTSCTLTNNDICNPGQPENVQNFMDYACKLMFTRGQRDEMQNALNSSVSERNNLWTAANLSATGCLNTSITCKPHADFDVNRTMICSGGSITLTDFSWGNPATSWSWILSGPVTLTSVLQNPIFSGLNTPGLYSVTLIATNQVGSDTLTKSDYILVSPPYSTFTDTYSEGFESPNVFNLGYIPNNFSGNGSIFQQTGIAGHTGTSSVYLNTYGNYIYEDLDELITPSYYLHFDINPKLRFSFAYATRDTTGYKNTQKLKVYSSTNCGQSWVAIWQRAGAGLNTAGLDTADFIPSDINQWETVTITLPSGPASNIRFKFEFTAPYDTVGNNLYIDDINIISDNVGIHENKTDELFLLYPNPGSGNTVLSYNLLKKTPVCINIYDLSGRLIRSENSGNQNAGSYSMTVCDESNPLAAGSYWIQMIAGDKISTGQLVVTGE